MPRSAELVAVCDNDPAALRDAVGKTQAQRLRLA